MSCESRRDAIFLLAADALEEGERRELSAHLETRCARCSEALAEARGALALLPQSLEPVPPPIGSRARLEARAAADARDGLRVRTPRAPRAARRAPATRRAAIAAAVALLLGAGGTALLAWRFVVAPLSARTAALARALETASAELAELRDALAEQDRELAALEAEAKLAAEQLRLLRAEDLEVMALSAAPPQRGASARIYWERGDYGCYLHAEHLAAPDPGRSYVLWLASASGELFAAGSFTPDARGEAALVTRLPATVAPIARVLVTEEPLEHGEQPTGAVQLSGSAAGGGRDLPPKPDPGRDPA